MISVPIVLYQNFYPYYLPNIKSLEINNFKEKTTSLSSDQINKIQKTTDSKKIEKENEIMFVGDYADVPFDSLNGLTYVADKLGIKDNKDWDRFKPPLVELSLSENFYKHLNLTDVYRFINIFKYFGIEPNWTKIEEIIKSQYDKEL